MINGIIFFQEGGAQVLGNLADLDALVQSIEGGLAQLKKEAAMVQAAKRKQLLDTLSKSELEKYLQQKSEGVHSVAE